MLVPTRIGHSTDTPIWCSRSSRHSTSARATTPYLATQYGPRPLFGHEPGERRGEQDVAALALLDDPRQERLDAVDRAPQVDVDRPAPVVVGHLEDRAADGDAGVVEHDVDRAEGVERGVGHRLHGLQRAHVADHAVGLGAARRAARRPRASRAPCSMSASTTVAPFDASTFAVARPIPLAPPVTTAPLPLSVSMAADPGGRPVSPSECRSRRLRVARRGRTRAGRPRPCPSSCATTPTAWPRSR